MAELYIARLDQLTKAQRAKLVAIGGGQPIEFPLGQSGLFLIERGLAFVNELGARHLTDAGHAVLAEIERLTATPIDGRNV